MKSIASLAKAPILLAEGRLEAEPLATRAARSGSSFISAAKEYLTTAKQLMRRVRDKVPYSSGNQMMLNSGSGWMVQGSPARLMRDYNQLVSSYTSDAKF